MKILFDHPLPFALAHGGVQVQIEQTKAALERRGHEVEFSRWWDDRQTGSLIHYWSVPQPAYLRMAREKGIPVVVTHTFSATCNRPLSRLKLQGTLTRAFFAVPGLRGLATQLSWQSFRLADRMVVGLQAERRVLETVFGVTGDRVATVPLGLNQAFLNAGKPTRSEPRLITTGTITEVKRCVVLAQMARAAQVPILFVGKPYNPGDSYWKSFAALIDGHFVQHRDHVSSTDELIGLLQASRGFVLFSKYENWSLSAHEAAACGLPVLLPDQPWSRECFGDNASYLHDAGVLSNAAKLRAFYDAAPTMPAPEMKFYSWDDVAERLEACYRSLLAR